MSIKPLFVLLALTLSIGTLSARPTVALVLEGGGAMGLAHVGVIRVLEELGIPVDIVVGTSMGSIVGGFYALGYDAQALDAIARTTPWGQLLTEQEPTAKLSYLERSDLARTLGALEFDVHGLKVAGGLLTGKRVVSYIDQVALEASAPLDFDKFPRRFRAVATDVGNGTRVVLSHGPLGDALRGSMGIPGLFAPYPFEGRYLVDGGIVSNLPIEVAKEMGADLILAVHLTSEKPYHPEDFERNPANALMRSLDILIGANVQRQLPLADLVLTVDLAPYSATDFAKAPDIIRRGYDQAEANKGALEAFANKVSAGSVPTKAEPLRIPTVPTVQAVRIDGVPAGEKAVVEPYFARLVGQGARHEALLGPFFDLEDQSDYSAVRFRTEPTAGGVTLVVDLTPKRRQDNAIRLNVLYQGTLSSAASTHRVVAPGVLFRDFTTPGSRLSADAEIFDAPGFQARFRQPITPLTFGEAFYRYQQQSDVYVVKSSVSYQYQTSYNRTGAVLGIAPGPGLELTAGLSFDWLGADDLPETNAITVDHTSALTGEFHFQNTDSMAFPSRGIDLSVGYLQSLPALASQGNFRVLQSAGSLSLPLPAEVSVTLNWRAGTDFSRSAASEEVAPTFYKPTLADRNLFPGPLYLAERVGSHVGAVGLETRRRWDGLGWTLGVPLYTLAKMSLGVVLPNAADWPSWSSYSQLSASGGLGLRIDDGHALVLQGGAIRKMDGEVLPFVALDLGSGDF